MLNIGKNRKNRKIHLDRRTLRKNNISVLTLDERWNRLFSYTEKTLEILRLEEELKELLKQRSRLTVEAKALPEKKKKMMEKIINLTQKVFDNNDSDAKEEMVECRSEINKINVRIKELNKEMEEIPDNISTTNIELLEQAVNLVYIDIRKKQKRADELKILIEETREKLRGYINEQQCLTGDYTSIYSYFHDLLGAEILQKLDIQFLE